MKNLKSKITNAALAIALLFCLPPSVLGTPFFIQGFSHDGGPQTNQIFMTQYPQTSAPFTVYGTNIIYGANAIVISPNAAGYASNWSYPGVYRFYITNLNVSFIANIPDTTNFQSLALYVTNLQSYAANPLNSYGVATNLLGFAPPTNNTSGIIFALGYTPANVTSLGTIAGRASNDFALATSLGTIAGRSSNDFALATSLGTIAGRASNDFALATSLGTIAGRASNDFALAASLGTIAGRGSNDFHLADGYIGVAGSVYNLATNGLLVWATLKTNGLPGSQLTNLPTGSLLSTTNGGFYTLSNLTWIAH